MVANFFEGGSADVTWWPDLIWPDLGPKILQNVRNECPLKSRKFQLSFSSRLAMAHEKHQGGLFGPPPGIGLSQIGTSPGLWVPIQGLTWPTPDYKGTSTGSKWEMSCFIGKSWKYLWSDLRGWYRSEMAHVGSERLHSRLKRLAWFCECSFLDL